MYSVSKQTSSPFTHRFLLRNRCVSLLVMLLGFNTLASANATTRLQPATAKNNPRIYDVTFRVDTRNKASRGWPYVEQTNWSAIKPTSFRVTDQTDKNLAYTYKLMPEQKMQWHVLFQYKDYQIHFNETSFSSELDNAAATKAPWSDNWNQEVASYLRPSKYIRSEDALFTSMVEKLINKETLPPHLAAKTLIRYCLQNTESTGLYADTKNKLTSGIQVSGAKYAFEKDSQGSACDAVCACVAALRAAGIPARPIIGVTSDDLYGNKLASPEYIVWGEYALPDIGWVPFNPKRMRGTADHLSLQEPWQGLGTLPYLNRRIPLAINFNLYDARNATQEIQINFRGSPQ
jgi:transglutaminase-like putative cysteine protease